MKWFKHGQKYSKVVSIKKKIIATLIHFLILRLYVLNACTHSGAYVYGCTHTCVYDYRGQRPASSVLNECYLSYFQARSLLGLTITEEAWLAAHQATTILLSPLAQQWICKFLACLAFYMNAEIQLKSSCMQHGPFTHPKSSEICLKALSLVMCISWGPTSPHRTMTGCFSMVWGKTC